MRPHTEVGATILLVRTARFIENERVPPKLSVIIPAYNEAERLGKSVTAILSYLNERRESTELIVVDDGSTDATSAVAEESLRDPGHVQVRVVRYEENRGKGYAVRLGLLEAKANIALFSDADLSTPITETPKLIEPIQSGECDLTFGSRALDRRLIGVHQPWRREQGGRVFNLIVRLATTLIVETVWGMRRFSGLQTVQLSRSRPAPACTPARPRGRRRPRGR